MENHFGYHYNLTGFECLSVLEAFPDFFSKKNTDDLEGVLIQQSELSREVERLLDEKHYFDRKTLIATFYKALV